MLFENKDKPNKSMDVSEEVTSLLFRVTCVSCQVITVFGRIRLGFL